VDAGFVALGLVQGALAGLNALGLVLLWRTTKVVNLAQPAIGLVGGVLTGMLVASSGWSFWWAAPVGVAAAALLGLASERLVLARLATLPRTVPMVATIGLAALFQAVQSGIPFAFGGQLPSYDVDLGVEVFVFPVLLKGPHLLALAALPVALVALWWFVHRSRVGTAAVATGQDLERSQALGVPAGFVRAVAWTLAGALSGVAGVLSIPVLGFSLGEGVGATVLLLALAPAALVGLRSLPATAAASLAVGVAYQLALVSAPTAGAADVLLAAVIVVALVLRRMPLERAAAAARASSWTAATSPPALPRRVQRDPRWRRACVVAALALVVVAACPPLWLAPSSDVRYGTGAAIALAAIAVATAWMFSGEIALGHWGIAALGAGTAYAVPGPLSLRVLAGLAAGTLAGLCLAVIARRRGALAAAVAGLALATAAPYWLLRAGSPALGVDGQAGAMLAGATAAATAVGVTWLRGHRLGVRMVAARDEPRRASGLGVRTSRASAAGMGLSGALAAMAGIIYLASVPAGIAPGAFDAARSLDVLAFAVVGGLGSALGAGLGAAVLVAAGVLLPAPWGAVATGAGVIWVVLVAPGGLGSWLARLRDRAGRALKPDAFPGIEVAGHPEADGEQHDDTADEAVLVVAGADTREAVAVRTVRAAVVASFCISAAALAALFGAPPALRAHLDRDLGPFTPWLVLAVSGVSAVAGVVRWRNWRAAPQPRWPIEATVVGGAALATAAFALSRDPLMVTLLALVAPVAGAWALAGLARAAASACVPRTRSAAAGLVVAAAVSGVLGAAHLAAVAGGGTVLDAARWSVLYLVVGLLAVVAAAGRLPHDRRRARERLATPARTGGRRRWAPLRLESLVVDLGAHRILDGASLEVRSGEVVALVGGNGAGKSTLLRAVAGLVTPAGGRIDVAGEEITALRPDERAAVGVAFVSGARPVFPDLTVAENLRVGGYLTHRTRRAFDASLEHVLSLVPLLADRLDTRAGLLSGGEQRQLAIAQTLFRRPALLLADELTLGLDSAAQTAVLRLLRTLADDGIGVVVVDHDLRALTEIADRAVVVHRGTTVVVEDMSNLHDIRSDLLAARFLAGSPR
jgi:ABC-type branched-subunit amino acid transport system ATPase component/branched-subunit amino acid ABC-type transport system permease component